MLLNYQVSNKADKQLQIDVWIKTVLHDKCVLTSHRSYPNHPYEFIAETIRN